jgi:hypothetical protein
VRLRQPASEYWDSTPARVAGFFDQHAAMERVLDYRAGLLVSAVVNANRKRGAQPAAPADFFASLRPARAAYRSASETLELVRSYFGLTV